MRYKFTENKEPERGDTRVREGFLMLPKLIGNELRWLERAAWVEIYVFTPGTMVNGPTCDWVELRWFGEVEAK
jgi:hypothetical protein